MPNIIQILKKALTRKKTANSPTMKSAGSSSAPAQTPKQRTQELRARCTKLGVSDGPVTLGSGMEDLGFAGASSTAVVQLDAVEKWLDRIEEIDLIANEARPSDQKKIDKKKVKRIAFTTKNWNEQHVNTYAQAVNNFYNS